jgi:hypothetical protein
LANAALLDEREAKACYESLAMFGCGPIYDILMKVLKKRFIFKSYCRPLTIECNCSLSQRKLCKKCSLSLAHGMLEKVFSSIPFLIIEDIIIKSDDRKALFKVQWMSFKINMLSISGMRLSNP